MPRLTREVLSQLRAEGRRVGIDRVQRYITGGLLPPPPVIGGNRMWRDEDVARLRRLIDQVDGPPAAKCQYTTPSP